MSRIATVRDNLIAARALIDTPEKWAIWRSTHGGLVTAIAAVTLNTEERVTAFHALRNEGASSDADLPPILSAFDRAIASQEQSE